MDHLFGVLDHEIETVLARKVQGKSMKPYRAL